MAFPSFSFLIGSIVALAAISASVHAILTKRNAGTAVAWVGLIWLSPLVGALLYALLGINRIQRRASELRAGAVQYRGSRDLPVPPSDFLATRLDPRQRHLGAIARLGNRVLERPLLGGNSITALDGGTAAFPQMLEAIARAQRSVTLTSYIFDDDRAGRRFVEALRDATRRGVEVRVLVDDVGARYSFPSILRALRRDRIRAASFMSALFHWRMPYLNLRSHRKILVVDGRIGFTGGMNIREGHWLELDPSHPIRDLHFRLEGPVVAELQEVFAEDWTFTTGERLEGGIWFPPMEPAGSILARGISDGPDVDFEKLPSIIIAAINTARESVRVLTPYFIPDRTLSSALELAALRGVDVSIILPAKSNLTLVQWASTTYWAPLLERGCRIFLTPPPFDHSKLILVDGCWILFGSANLDPRSLLLNFEFNVECYDETLARQMEDLVRLRLQDAREVGLQDMLERPLAYRLRDGLARLFSPFL